MTKIIKAIELVVDSKEEKKLLNESQEYIKGFYHGYATCKSQAEKQGYHKHIQEESK